MLAPYMMKQSLPPLRILRYLCVFAVKNPSVPLTKCLYKFVAVSYRVVKNPAKRDNMTLDNHMSGFTLADLAEQAMLDRGFIPEFPDSVLQEVAELHAPAAPLPIPSFRDLRNLLWVSIDNDDSRDLDQLTFTDKTAEGTDRVYVAVADVDALVKLGSAIDLNAAHNTTSVYTPTKIFPMLPLPLSTDLTSLNENAERCAIVIEMEIRNDGQFDRIGVYPAWVRNHAKLAYNKVATWLVEDAPLPEAIANIPGILEQLKQQDRLAKRIKEYRYREGALTFGTIEALPIVVDGIPVAIEETPHNRAHALIENFMIAANVTMTRYLVEQQIPVIRRIVREPERWDRIVTLARTMGEVLPADPDGKALSAFLAKQRKEDPIHFPDLSLAIIKLIGKGEYVVGLPGQDSPGHFDLAQRDYAHTTAPNRRYPDLIMQRLLKSHFYGKPAPYTNAELAELALHCTVKEDDATKVERRMRKSAAAAYLASHIGQKYSAIITGAGEKGTWVRLLTMPIEGKLVRGVKGLDVGDRLNVQLTHVDIFNGFIDFVRI